MDLDATLRKLAHEPGTRFDIAEVALLLAREEYGELDVEAVLRELDAMAHEARTFVRGSLTTRVHGLCRYLFHEMGFHGNQRDYYNPDNSYLNVVLETRTGIPISLSAVAMAIGQRSGLDVVGVGLPGHFIVKAIDGDEEVLFDPFHGGRILDAEDCEVLSEKITGVPFEANSFTLGSVPLNLIIQRMLNNLKVIYLGQEDFPRGIRIMERLRQLEPGDITQRRDLGVCYLHAGQAGKAIDHLRAYLRHGSQIEDAEEVVKLLQLAEKSIAQWN